jgi:hypothetical protein
MLPNNILFRVNADVKEVAETCKGNIFEDWKLVKQICINLFGSKIINSNEELLRKTFVNNYGKRPRKY